MRFRQRAPGYRLRTTCIAQQSIVDRPDINGLVAKTLAVRERRYDFITFLGIYTPDIGRFVLFIQPSTNVPHGEKFLKYGTPQKLPANIDKPV